ncbi:MAG: peptidylprolyl isomerase [Pseudomonadota bacterium]
MLSTTRNLARSPLAVVIIIVPVVAAFALFGISDIFTGTGNAVALVGSERVTAQELSRSYAQQVNAIRQQNPRFTDEEANAMQLGEQVLSRLIAEHAIDAKANELGLAVSDEAIVEAIEEIPAFNNPFSGQFDRATYRAVLADNEFTEASFEESLRGELRRSQFLAAALGGVSPPGIFERARQAYAGERRRMRALFLSPSLAGEIADPTDEELQAFIEENAASFTYPEQRRFTLVRITPDDLLPDVDVPEEDLRTLYEIQLDNGELADAPTRSFVQLSASDQETAEAAAARLQAGENPETVAAELGLVEPVTFEAVQSFAVPDTVVSEAVFAMASGDASAVEGALGWRAVRVEAATDPVVPSFEERRGALQAELAMNEAEGRLFDTLAAFEEARGAGATLDEAAEAAQLPIERLDFITQQGFTLTGEAAMTLFAAPEILEQVFTMPESFDGELTNFGDGGYFAVRVDAVEESRLATLEEERERVETFWRMRAVDDQLQAVVDNALQRARDGEDMDVIAQSIGLGARVEAATLRRDETAGPFAQQLVAQAFSLPPQQAFTSRADDQRTRAIVLVDEVLAPEPAPLTAEEQAELAEGLRGDFAIGVEAGLMSAYEVTIDPRLRDLALGRSDPAQ